MVKYCYLLLFFPFILSSVYAIPPVIEGDPIPGDVGTISAGKDKIRFIIITEKGYVSFVAEEAWSIQAVKSSLPVAVVEMQLFNTGDKETPDSTNLAIMLIQEDAEKSKGIMGLIGKKIGTGDLVEEKYKDWTVYHQEGKQGETVYSLYDAKRKVGDLLVAVRLAWPHLKSNAATYDKDTIKLFYAFLDSVEGKAEAYKRKNKELFRRPGKED